MPKCCRDELRSATLCLVGSLARLEDMAAVEETDEIVVVEGVAILVVVVVLAVGVVIKVFIVSLMPATVEPTISAATVVVVVVVVEGVLLPANCELAIIVALGVVVMI